jgi:hypothetical protein
MGADAVVKGGGDLVWSKIVEDALLGRLQRVYDGGRVPGEYEKNDFNYLKNTIDLFLLRSTLLPR